MRDVGIEEAGLYGVVFGDLIYIRETGVFGRRVGQDQCGEGVYPCVRTNIVEVLKTLPKFARSGNLSLGNPFYNPAEGSAANQPTPTDVEALMSPFFDAAQLSQDRAALFLMEELPGQGNPDIIIVVLCATLGRLWPHAKSLEDVAKKAAAVVPRTIRAPLAGGQALALRAQEQRLDATGPTGTAGRLSQAQLDALAAAIKATMDIFGWQEPHLLSFLASTANKGKRQNFVYTKIRQVLGRTVSLAISASSVLRDSGAMTSSGRTPRKAGYEGVFDRHVRAWVSEGRVQLGTLPDGTTTCVVTVAAAYGSTALPATGAAAGAGVIARYERMLAKALNDLDPACSTLLEQATLLGKRGNTAAFLSILGTRARQYNLPGTAKDVKAECSKVASQWRRDAEARGKDLGETLTIRDEIELHRLLAAEGVDPRELQHRRLGQHANMLASELGLPRRCVERRLANYRRYLPLAAALAPVEAPATESESEGEDDGDNVSLYSSGPGSDTDEGPPRFPHPRGPNEIWRRGREFDP